MYLYRFIRGVVTIITSPINRFKLFMGHVQIGNHFLSCGTMLVRNYAGKGGISIGNNCAINSCRLADPIGGDSKTILYTCKNGKISIGDHVGISNATLFSMSSIEIGDHTRIGGGSKIYDTDFHSTNPKDRANGNINIPTKPVKIGKNVFIGGHVLILKGVTIGDESVIGGGSVVTKNVPPSEIWAGNPAKCVGIIKKNENLHEKDN